MDAPQESFMFKLLMHGCFGVVIMIMYLLLSLLPKPLAVFIGGSMITFLIDVMREVK